MFARDPRQSSGLLGTGERVSGAEVREQNVQAAVAIANIVRTSLGPHGLDKMLVDDIGVSCSCEAPSSSRLPIPLHPPSSCSTPVLDFPFVSQVLTAPMNRT